MMEIKSLKSMRKQLTKEQNYVSKHIEAQTLWQNQSCLGKKKRQLGKLLKNGRFYLFFCKERKISAISASSLQCKDRDRSIRSSNARTKTCKDHQQHSRARLDPIDSGLPVSFRILIKYSNELWELQFNSFLAWNEKQINRLISTFI